MAQTYTYVPSVTGAKFQSAELGTYLYKGVRGVPGDGKTVDCIWDMYFKAEMQPPFFDAKSNQWVRWSRWLVGRHTFPALKQTTIPSIVNWFPRIELHESPPLRGYLEMPSMHNDGTVLRMEFVFYSMDSKNIMDDLPSLELSGAYINEASQIEFRKIFRVQERVGRFKPPGAAAQGWKGLSFGIIMDTNTPTETSWWYDLEQVQKPPRMLWFVKPPAMIRQRTPPPAAAGCTYRKSGEFFYIRNDEAGSKFYGTSGPCENVEHQNEGWDYYEKQLIGASEDDIKMRLLNQYGRTKDGLPVYPEWLDEIHCTSEPMEYARGLPLLLGMDFGRNPACVFGQVTRMGQVRIFDELTAFNMSVPQFVDRMLMPKLVDEFSWPNTRVVNFGDPAGMNAGEMYDIGCIEYLNGKGIPTAKPETLKNNDFDVRRDAVSNLLRSNYKGTPSLLVSAKCKMLRDGFNGDYCYKKVRTADGSDKYTDKADKNEYSHVHDALQYLVVGALGGSVDYSKPGGTGLAQDYSYLGSGADFSCI